MTRSVTDAIALAQRPRRRALMIQRRTLTTAFAVVRIRRAGYPDSTDTALSNAHTLLSQSRVMDRRRITLALSPCNHHCGPGNALLASEQGA